MAGVGATATLALAAGCGLTVCCSQALSCTTSLQSLQAGLAVMPSRDAHWKHLVGMSINIPLGETN